MTNTDHQTCMLCGCEKTKQSEWVRYEIQEFECPSCGMYFVTRCDYEDLRDHRPLREKAQTWKLSALCRERVLAGRAPYFIRFTQSPTPPRENAQPIFFEELLDQWPIHIGDQLNRALVNLSREHPSKGKAFRTPQLDMQLLFAAENAEANLIKVAIEEAGYISVQRMANLRNEKCTLTPAGWMRVAELEAEKPGEDNPVFVAMWYGDETSRAEMDALFEHSIKPAVFDAGYRVTRADIEPHNDFIMNQVLGDIRVAPFVVADFTGNRNGVYFESGFARGLGITVINTSKRSDFEKAHFDTKQLMHLLWDEPPELREKLLQHIRGSIGEGPYVEQVRDGRPVEGRSA